MKLIDLLDSELNEMASITNADDVVKLIKAGKYPEAVAEMLKVKQLKVVPGNVTSQISAKEKASFSEELKKANPSATRGPGTKAAEKRVETAVTEKKTSVQDQSVIKKKLMNTLIKAAKAVQDDPKISDEEKQLNNEALEILKDALVYTMNFKAGLLTPKSLETSASKRQSKIADEFLKKNAPEALARAKAMADEHKEDIQEYIQARKDYIEKMKKDEGRDTTPAKDIDSAQRKGLLKRISKVESPSDDEIEKRIGADDETISKEIKSEEKAASDDFSRNFDKKYGEQGKEKIARDKVAEMKRCKAKYDEAVATGKSEAIVTKLKQRYEASKEVAKVAKADLVKEVWKKRNNK